MAKKTNPKAEDKKPAKRVSQEEFEKRIIQLSEQGFTAEKIGETLRKEGLHPKEHSKKISEILKEKGRYEVPEVKNTKVKLERISSHFEKNRQDKRAMRERERIFSKLRKLERYHTA